MLNERSDVYSFGILIMEIISGRSPVDYARPNGEVRDAPPARGSTNKQRSRAKCCTICLSFFC
jgi:serine/threonine protein kinase